MTIYGEQTVITWSTLSTLSATLRLMDEIALITVLPEKCVGLFMIAALCKGNGNCIAHPQKAKKRPYFHFSVRHSVVNEHIFEHFYV